MELAIVVVVAGLILAALLLRGETVVGGARTTEAIALARDVIEAANRFRQTYRYWPGDLPNAASNLANLPAVCDVAVGSSPTIGNGSIDASESACAVDQLFSAGLVRAEAVPGPPVRYQLRTIYGAVRVISSAASNVTTFPAGVQVVEFANLPCGVAQELDNKIDDGDIALGSVGRAGASVASCTVGGANDPVPFFAVRIN